MLLPPCIPECAKECRSPSCLDQNSRDSHLQQREEREQKTVRRRLHAGGGKQQRNKDVLVPGAEPRGAWRVAWEWVGAMLGEGAGECGGWGPHKCASHSEGHVPQDVEFGAGLGRAEVLLHRLARGGGGGVGVQHIDALGEPAAPRKARRGAGRAVRAQAGARPPSGIQGAKGEPRRGRHSPRPFPNNARPAAHAAARAAAPRTPSQPCPATAARLTS